MTQHPTTPGQQVKLLIPTDHPNVTNPTSTFEVTNLRIVSGPQNIRQVANGSQNTMSFDLAIGVDLLDKINGQMFTVLAAQTEVV
jgi:hypothetical protein